MFLFGFLKYLIMAWTCLSSWMSRQQGISIVHDRAWQLLRRHGINFHNFQAEWVPDPCVPVHNILFVPPHPGPQHAVVGGGMRLYLEYFTDLTFPGERQTFRGPDPGPLSQSRSQHSGGGRGGGRARWGGGDRGLWSGESLGLQVNQAQHINNGIY